MTLITRVIIIHSEVITRVIKEVDLNRAIAKAVEILGSQNKLAEACGMSQPSVIKWLKGGGISAVSAKKIEDATQGKVTMREVAEGVKNE